MVRTYKHKEVEPYKCDKCGAMVFVLPNLHAYACVLYRKTPELVSQSHTYYEVYLKDKAAEEARKAVEGKPKRRRKRDNEDTGVQDERPAGRKGRNARRR